MHIASRAERQRKFGNIVAVRRIDEEDKIAATSSEIKMLELYANLLDELTSSLDAFRCILDPLNPCSVQFSVIMNLGMMMFSLCFA